MCIFLLLGATTFCVLAEKVVMRVTNLMKRDLYDIVKVDWFKRCIDAQRFIPWYDEVNIKCRLNITAKTM